MGKRVLGAFLAVAVFFGGLIFRVAFISRGEYAEAGASQSARVVEVARSRGMIYDRNMLPLVCETERIVLAVNPTRAAAECLRKELTEAEYSAVAEQLEAGKPFVAQCSEYNGSCSDITPLTVYDRYGDNSTAAHILGYLNGEGVGVAGIEAAFDEYLSENSGSLKVRFFVDAGGRGLAGKGLQVVDDNYASDAGVVTTIDRNVQKICERVLAERGVKKGAVAVLDTWTSEILAMASVPVYDRNDMESSLNNNDSPFLNRCLCAYSVGSVFKTVVAAAALEKGIDAERTFSCDGSVQVGDLTFRCHNWEGHGEVDMAQALAVSCNAYFIQLGLETGEEKILSVAQALGLGSEIGLAEGIISESGNLPKADEIDSGGALANLSFGQGTLLATPLQIGAVYCAFANGGYYREPHLFKEIIDKNGNIEAYYKNEIENKVIPDSICEMIEDMLRGTVEEGSGKQAKPMCFGAMGKTATAETGWLEDGREIVHTWFAGSFPEDEPKYTVVVFIEDGESSSTDCAPIFRDIADYLTAEYGENLDGE